jgi:predicted CoA-binding protein
MPSKRQFLESNTIAVFGVSPKRKTMASEVEKALIAAGHKVYRVNPEGGDNFYKDLDSLPEKTDAVYIAINKSSASALIDDIVAYGAKKVWLQYGAYDKKIIDKCENAGLETYAGCPMMFIPNAGAVHSFHRFFYELFKGKQ